MSDDAQKLRLRTRVGAGDQTLPANPIESDSDHGGVEHPGHSDSTPDTSAGAPPRLRPDLEARGDLGGFAQRVVTSEESRPRQSPASPNPSPIAAPLPSSIQGAQRTVLVLGVALIIIFVAAGFLAYRLFISPSGGAKPADVPTASAPAANSPRPPLNAASAEPSGLPVGSGVPTQSPAAPVEPESAADSPAHTSTGNVSSPFRTWVDNVKISGVRVSSNPRILIGKVSFNQGDVVDEKLGIIFVGYDKDRYLVRFQDSSGAILERQDRVLVPINAPPTAAPRQPNR